MYAFHFNRTLDKLNFTQLPLFVGKWLPPLRVEICKSGYHASPRALDALNYRTGSCVSLVEFRGGVQWRDDKLCASERRHLWIYDASDELRRFARVAALEVVDKWDAPKVVLDWLETGDESLRYAAYSAARYAACYAADSAAYSAARYAAYDAADVAAYSAAYSAADDAAYDAASSAAYDAADVAAYSAAYSAACADLNAILESIILTGAIERGLWQ